MNSSGFMKREHLQRLIDVLHDQGFCCIGPRIDAQAIVYDEIKSVSQLPVGIQVEQSPGIYKLEQHSHKRHFSWANTAQAIKPLTFTAEETLWKCEKDAKGNLKFVQQLPETKALAIIGARACDLAALKLQQQHFLNQYSEDPWFKQRIGSLFIIAIHCSHAADTCFCHATGDGPLATEGFDIAMHELDDGFLVEAGSDSGEKIIQQLPLDEAKQEQHQAANEQIQQSINKQSRSLPDHVEKTLLTRLEHPRWEQVGKRCLSCGNCTAVCPTCFCHQQLDDVSIADNTASHYRQWSSCFTHHHGYISGYSLRPTTAKRYRQWLTHKFATWYDQYGRSGCVGCGRCISWCPVGIDVTEELKALCE